VPIFLSRPRRFGKTLLLDTIQRIFEGKRELFSGLEIEKRLGSKWDAFPVIRIPFNAIKTDPAKFEESLLFGIKNFAFYDDISLEASNPSDAIAELILKLSKRHQSVCQQNSTDRKLLNKRNVVLLIDEYDFPLIGNIGRKTELESIRLTLREFYSAVKCISNFLHFVLITGITKFRQISLFSSMNTVYDISLDKYFSTICGFTKQEIQSTFSQYFEPTLLALKQKGELSQNSAVDDLLDNIIKWYNGYSWGGESEVLNPLSVLSFFKQKSFKNYWYKTGSSLLTSRISQNDIDYFKVFGQDLSFNDSFPEMDLNDLNATVLLMQAGYLTVRSVTGSGNSEKYHLEIPNNEIRDSIRRELLAGFLAPQKTSDYEQFLNQKYIQFLDAFGTRDADKCELYISAILAGIIQRNPGNQHGQQDSVKQNEFCFRSILQLLLEFGNKLSMPEAASDIGKADLAVQGPHNEWVVIEMKFEAATISNKTAEMPVPDSEIVIGKRTKFITRKLQTMIRNAFKQLTEKNYAKKYLVESTDVYGAAVAVYGTSDVMVRFKKVVWSDKQSKTIAVV
ncbi:MAG: AAA family ATPase, partial [Deltaproteobacteria bacterium]|nr:AAA family ATPase [Deltaproteobacteria bacterium]